jgi:putative sigma-54 modulation protein
MQIEFTLKNTHATGSEVKQFLDDKTGKLSKYFQGRIHAKWVIAYENDEHISHLHVTGSAGEYFSEARQHNLLSSIEEAVERVERQLKKHKEILKDHHK